MKKLLYLLIFIFVFCLLPKTAEAGIIFKPVFHTGLVGYWDLQEGAGMKAYDKSGYDNDGTLTNMTESDWVDGKIGQALDFDGIDDYVGCGSDSSIDDIFSGGGTITAWIYAEGPGENAYGRIVDKASDTNGANGYGFEMSGANNIRLERGFSTTRGVWYPTTALVSYNVWHYVAVAYNEDSTSNDPSIYIDGSLQALTEQSAPVGSATSDAAQSMIIGNFSTTGTRTFNGIIDGVRIYNRALSAGEVERLYKLSQPKIVAPTRTGLVGYWPFEEGTGIKAGDHSGNGNNGDLTNMEEADWVDGKLGGALDFDGSNEYVDLGNGKFDLAILSVCAWFKTNGPTGSDRRIVTSGSENTNLWVLSISHERLEMSNTDASHVTPATTNTVDDSQWHFACGINNPETLYLNGVQQTGSETNSWSFEANAKIGGRGSAYNFLGLIDEVRIYNRALEANEIEALYKSGRAKINASQNTKLTDGLVGLWSFNGPDMDGNDAFDRSGQGNHGTLDGPVRTIGRIGQALDFDGGNDRITITKNEVLKPSNITIAFWINPSEDTIIEGWNGVMTGAYGSGYSNGWRIVDYTNKPRVQMNFGDASPVGPRGNAMGVGNWHHVVVTYDHTYLRLYQNGSSVGTPVSETRDINWTTTGDLLVGFAQSYFYGLIDEVRIYNRALSAQEIQRLYNMGR